MVEVVICYVQLDYQLIYQVILSYQVKIIAFQLDSSVEESCSIGDCRVKKGDQNVDTHPTAGHLQVLHWTQMFVVCK